jgi:hypothetical protein
MSKKRYFNTKEAAERHLEFRRKAAYKRIEKKGWKVVGDNSFVHQNELCYCENLPHTHHNKGKWFVFLGIITDELINDLNNFRPIDAITELEMLMKEFDENKEMLREITKSTIYNFDKVNLPKVSRYFS